MLKSLSSLRRDVKAWSERTFKERELILRSDGRVHYFRLSERMQKAAVAALVLLSFVPLLAGLASYLQSRELAANNEALQIYRQAYVAVLGEAKSYHEEFARRLGEGNPEQDLAVLDRALHARQALRERLRVVESLNQKLATPDEEAIAITAELHRLLDLYDGEEQDTVEAAGRLDYQLQVAQMEIQKLNGTKQDLESELADKVQHIANTEAQIEELTGQRARLTDEVKGLEDRIVVEAAEEAELKNILTATRKTLEQTNQQLAEVQEQRSWLSKTLVKTEIQLAELGKSQERVVNRLNRRTADSIDAIEQVLAMTGLDVDAVLGNAKASQEEQTVDQGGPFIPNEPLTHRDPALALQASVTHLDSKLDHWENLQDLVRSLPFAAPLEQYRVTSNYGLRIDPVNKKKSSHYGVDLGAPMRSEIYSPAPGRVVFAGWKGHYGRLIEIDHGNGVRTRYGHLKKISVKVGQNVGHREAIGLLGSSGRSTGPHLHYEISVKGKTYNPLSFLEAGLYFYKS